MRHARSHEKLLALNLVFAVGFLGVPAIAAPAPAALSGRILRSTTGAPMAGAVLKVALRPDARKFQSTQTDAKGQYSIANLPVGTYDLAVEADGGLYVVGGTVGLEAGEKRSLSLSLLPNAEEETPGGQAPEGEQPKEEPKEEPKEKPKEKPKEEPPKSKAGKGSWLRSPWVGAGFVIGSAVVVGAIVESSDNDEPATASPSD